MHGTDNDVIADGLFYIYVTVVLYVVIFAYSSDITVAVFDKQEPSAVASESIEKGR